MSEPGTGGATWVVVLIKDFDAAKQRLRPALSPAERRELAQANARKALVAARAGDRVLAVCGSVEAAALARSAGADVLLEEEPGGQNPAARRGIDHVVAGGAAAVLLVSSDLPLITRRALADLLAEAARHGAPVVVAAPATGRGGTNGLYLAPPNVIDLHFGDDSLGKFQRDAAGRGVRFVFHESEALALDLDEPSDLAALAMRP
jgi:2-phospho-L-lactate/phosphoenolpyruvate guanylyltransferase